ncbi:bifunctional DNA primase/polymerase [Geodermatophilus marinus]|uniref:bifunctional DNA primase/polymerase n=1 Tax=Geodermatophilus sp. LHW52908 TaxID=2303986 RepID=UPI000E3C5EDE|nr:bifunctional DNA primase/polymerase [Geodermatophilus sp. LHW52908]RFU18826.1 DNA primase [Geodermatophilus sp. LHW52908]
MPRKARGDARYCSGRCRVAAHRAARAGSPVPAELRALSRWVRYSARKVPLTVAGRAASSTAPATWATWEDVQASSAGVGAGFVLDGDGIVCLDLDHCVSDGMVAPWAQAVLNQLPRTYVEVSPSGRGLHVWGRADMAAGRVVRVPGGKVEVYPVGRFVTITGRPLPGSVSRLGDLSSVVGELVG